ncbi:hypothetical protein [Bacillus sp. FJAT-49736]|nr:hypothetical protein [Bacillus sp. FJAT-49736]MBS4173621.1 hypothetical protein [Bacillus sp. FJAT-49736]
MILNLIFTKMNMKKKNTVKEHKQLRKIEALLEQNKLKHNDMMLRHYY